MLTRPDSCWFPDLLADAAVQIVEEEGVSKLSGAAVARRLRVTPQAVHKRTTGPRSMIDCILSVVAERWLDTQSRRWMSAVNLHGPAGLEGLVSMLPSDRESVTDLRVWLDLVELARADRNTPEVLGRVRREETRLVEISLGRLADRVTNGAHEETDLVLSVLYGLRVRLTDPAETVDPERAERLLRRAVEAIRAQWSTPTERELKRA